MSCLTTKGLLGNKVPGEMGAVVRGAREHQWAIKEAIRVMQWIAIEISHMSWHSKSLMI
jgi:hypothetical protein